MQINLQSGANAIDFSNITAEFYILIITTNNQTKQWKIQVIN